MSRLAHRIARLERQLGRGCPACAARPGLIQMVGPSGRRLPDVTPERCPACGSEQKVVTVLLAFEPDRYDPKPEPTP